MARRAAEKGGQIAGLDQVRALAHPLRLRLMELFVEQPTTTKQAAERLGQPPTRLYHHVAALERAGLIRLASTRANRGATEKYFEAVGKRFVGGAGVAALLAGEKAGRDRTAVGALVFDQARNELVRALAAGGAARHPTLLAIRAVLHLSPAGANRLKKRLMAILAEERRGQASAAGGKRRRYAITLALVPAGEVGDVSG